MFLCKANGFVLLLGMGVYIVFLCKVIDSFPVGEGGICCVPL